MKEYSNWKNSPLVQVLFFVVLIVFISVTPFIDSKDFDFHNDWSFFSVGEQENVSSAVGRPTKEQIDQGFQYLKNTHTLLPKYVGAQINCTNCHLDGGKRGGAGSWINVTKRYPKYRDRTGKKVDLPDRINDCFQRSLNGNALPKDHPAMSAMIAYMESLEIDEDYKDFGVRKLDLGVEPDLENGKKIYASKCFMCHQSDGKGLVTNEGVITFPPVWGEKSFNIAAGMARLRTAAGFVKHNMPQGQEGSLTDKEAWDVAYFFSQQPRPDYPDKRFDWPKGNKPKDARY